MTLSAFPYPGGKTYHVDEILPYFPEHERYVEPFGGSAALLLNKPRSHIEVLNDLDNDVMNFDPEDVPRLSTAAQTGLESFTGVQSN